MGMLTYVKIGGAVVILLIASYFVWNYKHMQTKIATLEVQVAEQHEVIATYEKFAAVDKETQEVHNEIKQAVQANDTARVRELYERLRKHQRSIKGKAPGASDDGESDD